MSLHPVASFSSPSHCLLHEFYKRFTHNHPRGKMSMESTCAPFLFSKWLALPRLHSWKFLLCAVTIHVIPLKLWIPKDVFWLLSWGKFVFTVRDPITLWPGPHPKCFAIPCLERRQDTPQRAGVTWTEAIKTDHQPYWRFKRAEAEWERTYIGDSRGRN